MAKLLVIGNGFDLHCGLQSTYAHFFDYLVSKQEYSNVYDYFDDNRYDRTLVRTNMFWALLLAYHDDENIFWWKDIEAIISSFLYKKIDEYPVNLSDIIDNINHYYNELKQVQVSSLRRKTPTIKFLWLLYRGIGLHDVCTISSTANRDRYDVKPKSVESIVDLLYSDLNEIENKFVEYLKGIYNSATSAHENANNTYKKLLNVGLSDDISEDGRATEISNAINNANILSFNYTRLGQPNGVDFERYKNIHGTFVGNFDDIIFGIDSKDINPMDPIFKFTKTYRVALLESSRLVSPDLFYGRISLNDIQEIIIYGHSLNIQDYSYFYAIFNKVDINGSNVVINYYYSNYDGENKAPENILRLQNLLFEFEIAFQKPKGLFHRMLLEDRIHIIKL